MAVIARAIAPSAAVFRNSSGCNCRGAHVACSRVRTRPQISSCKTVLISSYNCICISMSYRYGKYKFIGEAPDVPSIHGNRSSRRASSSV